MLRARRDRRGDECEGGVAVPRHDYEPAFERDLIAALAGERERLAAAGRVGRDGVRPDEEAVEPAGLAEGIKIRVARGGEKGAVGVEQFAVTVDQEADREPIENRNGGGR